MKRKALKGVLGNLLGTFVSQYTRWNGQLLFGCIVEDLSAVEFDLLSESPSRPPGPLAEAERIVRMKFTEQLGKAGLDRSFVREARLRMERSEEMTEILGSVWLGEERRFAAVMRLGYRMRFHAAAVTDLGRRYEAERFEFIWPNGPSSGRGPETSEVG